MSNEFNIPLYNLALHIFDINKKAGNVVRVVQVLTVGFITMFTISFFFNFILYLSIESFINIIYIESFMDADLLKQLEDI